MWFLNYSKFLWKIQISTVFQHVLRFSWISIGKFFSQIFLISLVWWLSLSFKKQQKQQVDSISSEEKRYTRVVFCDFYVNSRDIKKRNIYVLFTTHLRWLISTYWGGDINFSSINFHLSIRKWKLNFFFENEKFNRSIISTLKPQEDDWFESMNLTE